MDKNVRQPRRYISYSEDTAADNVSSPKPRTRGGYSEDTRNGLEITAALCANAQ